MKLKREFANAIINDRIANAGQWQLQVESIKSNYVFITDLLKKEQALSPEVINRGQDLQEQLIGMLAQFVRDMDELDENTTASDRDSQALFARHIQEMSELNGCIHTFLNSIHPTPNLFS